MSLPENVRPTEVRVQSRIRSRMAVAVVSRGWRSRLLQLKDWNVKYEIGNVDM